MPPLNTDASAAPSSMETARRPTGSARGYLKNLFLEELGNPELPDMIEFPFRPNVLRLDAGVNDETMNVLGMSHQYDVYSNTNNATISFDIYMNALMMVKEGMAGGQSPSIQEMSSKIQDYRRFIEALLYPPFNPSGVIGAQQTPCILCLPGFCTLRVKLKSLGEVLTDCGAEGDPKEFSFTVSFREAPLARISMEEVMLSGMFRTWGL